jgi:thiol-disulfide isomerase/thioredoxin
MKYLLFFIPLLFLSTFVKAQSVALPDDKASVNPANSGNLSPQPAASVPFTYVNKEWLEERFNQMSDSTYVINFWATWCKPCVEELPIFNLVRDGFVGQNVTVLLISTDSKKIRDTKLATFITEKDIRSQVLWMNESNPNDWINTVNPNWSGAIPATLVFNKHNGYMWFQEGEVTIGDIQLKILESQKNPY